MELHSWAQSLRSIGPVPIAREISTPTPPPAKLLLPPFELRGFGVFLRPLSSDDAPVLVAAASESREHYGFSSVPNGLDESQRWIEKALNQRDAGQRLPFVIHWRDRIVGATSFVDLQSWEWPAGSPWQRGDRPDAVEIGYTWLAASAQRTGCNTAAKYVLLAHAFDVWDLHRVAFRTDERNQRSRRAIERLGARLDGIRRADAAGRDGSVRNSAYFSILRAEWPGIRERFTRTLLRANDSAPPVAF
jgi:RimJ/RimL family protein N-acetyltransferase